MQLGIKSIEVGARVLDVLAQARAPLMLRDLAAKARLSPSAAHRRIINEALQKARDVHTELIDIKQKATVYRARFRTLVQSHLDILDNTDWESLEELEEGLEEAGKQLDQYAEDRNDNMILQQPGDDYRQTQDYSQDSFVSHSPLEDTNPPYDQRAYMGEEEEPHRDLRRTSRKMKRKAMF